MTRARRLLVTLAAVTAAAGSLAGSSAHAETVTTSGQLSITPGWSSSTFSRNQLVLPFTVTAACDSTDYGSGFVATSCHTVTVDLVHSSSPASEDSDLVFPKDDGTGAGSLTLYGFMLKGFGPHTLRATDKTTGQTVSTTITLKALTSASFTGKHTGTKVTVRGTLTAFDGYSYSPLGGRSTLILQRKAGARWTAVKTATTVNGAASWMLTAKGKATYRVCHTADVASTAACSSARSL